MWRVVFEHPAFSSPDLPFSDCPVATRDASKQIYVLVSVQEQRTRKENDIVFRKEARPHAL